jgi:hypothetical protein
MPKISTQIETLEFKRMLFFLLSFICFLYLIYNTYSLATGTYKEDQKKYYKLDTITLQDKAYLYAGSGKSSSKGYEFRDTSWQSYKIDDLQYHAITDFRLISDTLKYDGTRFVVYTDKEGLEIYNNKRKSESIRVYQLSIGGKKYVDISKVNSIAMRKKNGGLILVTCFYLFCLNYYRNVKKRKQLTQ